ncbi:MAG: hypothetical protein ACI89J_002147 [Hyphomicrobiaceae bacterium]|jgi:hypothetical protein
MPNRITHIRILSNAMLAVFCLSAPFAANAQQSSENMSRAPWPSQLLPQQPITARICSCRYAGQNIPIGETVCMKFEGKSVRATCDSVVNNPSWSISTEICPTT